MRFSAVALAAVLCACHARDANDPDALVARLQAGDPQARIAAIDQLRKTNARAAAPRIAEQLRDPSTRAAAASALASLGGAEQVKPLVDAIDASASAEANAAIAQALGAIGDPRATPGLLQLAKMPQESVRAPAIAALGKLRARDALPDLLELGDDASTPVSVLKSALVALGRIGDPAAVPVLLRALNREPGGVSLLPESSLALMMIGAPAVDPLLKIAEGKDAAFVKWAREQGRSSADVHARAALVLGDIGDPRAIPALRRLLKYAEPKTSAPDRGRALTNLVRMFASSALGRLRAKEAAPQLQALVTTLDEDDEQVTSAAAEALVWIGDRAQARELMVKAHGGKLRLRLIVAQAAALFGEPILGRDMLQIAMKEAKGSPGECRDELRALTFPVDDPARACDLLATQFGELANPFEATRVCASDAPCWLGKLRDADPVVRARAAYELGRTGAAGAVPELSKATADEQALVRVAATRALEWLTGVPAARLDLQRTSASLESRLAAGSDAANVRVDEDLRRLQVKLSRL